MIFLNFFSIFYYKTFQTYKSLSKVTWCNEQLHIYYLDLTIVNILPYFVHLSTYLCKYVYSYIYVYLYLFLQTISK